MSEDQEKYIHPNISSFIRIANNDDYPRRIRLGEGINFNKIVADGAISVEITDIEQYRKNGSPLAGSNVTIINQPDGNENCPYCDKTAHRRNALCEKHWNKFLEHESKTKDE